LNQQVAHLRLVGLPRRWNVGERVGEIRGENRQSMTPWRMGISMT